MGKQTFSAFPKEGMRFLRSLKRNNSREWFQKHKTNYETYIKQPMTDLIEAIGITFQNFAPEMTASPKISAYRIYRDTRFSKDKTPYKTHAAAIFSRTGLGKHEGAAFYLQIAPEQVLIGGGLYMPEPEDLSAVRNLIAKDPERFLTILKNRKFKQMFGSVEGEQLSRLPRGFPPQHIAEGYLRHKQFLAARTLSPELATSARFYRTIVETFQTLLPLIRFLNEPIVRARRSKDRQAVFFR